MNECPLYYVGEVVLYYGKLVEILDARYYREESKEKRGFIELSIDGFYDKYTERYIIKYVDPVNNFEHNLQDDDGRMWHNVNKCPGEYFTRVEDLLNTEEIFNELYGKY